MLKQLPLQGYVFWPVGNGDSTTVAVDKKIIMQMDINHTSVSEDDDDPRVPVLDELLKLLPKVDDKPYLSVFVLTHPDEDHCSGFKDLLAKAKIGEIWFTPRIFAEYSKDLCEEAKAFKNEAKRRVKKVIQNSGSVQSGDRIRIIGYGDILKEDDYKGFPQALLTVPGNEIVYLDGKDCNQMFRAFVHSPFKDDMASDRNDTSLGLQVMLKNDDVSGKSLLLGDLCYPTVRRIFTRSKSSDLEWNVFLAPHHCSKSVMYWKEEDEEEEKLKQKLLDDIKKVALSPGYIVSSSNPIPGSNKEGDNPPHAKAKKRYEEIVPDKFLCTQEHPNEESPEPIVFVLGEKGLEYQEPQGKESEKSKGLSGIIAKARGDDKPPTSQVGFGL
jgi:hypothetical protein